MDLSVVIPSYNGGNKLRETLERLLQSEVSGLNGIEVLVVDDGSPTPVLPVVLAPGFHSGKIMVRCIRQDNGGPAAARNTGFRETQGRIVLFLDDDILVPPDLLHAHFKAHQDRPGSVLFGRCPYVEPNRPTPVLEYVNSQGHDPASAATDPFLEMPIVASGQISVERSMFADSGAVYCDELKTPAAEEYDLSLRLRDRGIPKLLVTRLIAAHNHAVTLDFICQGAFKHAMGCAEAALRAPHTLGLPELRHIISVNGWVSHSDARLTAVKKGIKRALSSRMQRRAVLHFARVAESRVSALSVLGPIYRFALGLHFFAGVRNGLEKYANSKAVAPC